MSSDIPSRGSVEVRGGIVQRGDIVVRGRNGIERQEWHCAEVRHCCRAVLL